MAVRTISTKLAIEGEAEYKKSIQNINSALSTLKSELKLVESNFQGQANSYAALEAKGSVLADMYDEQAKKLSATKEALEKWQEVQRKCADEAENAKASVEKLEKELAALGEESDGTGDRQKELQAALDKAREALANSNDQYDKATQKCNFYQKSVNSTQIDLNKLSNELEKNAQYLAEAETSADGCATSIDRYGKEIKQAADSSEDCADSVEDYGKAAKEAGDDTESLAEKLKSGLVTGAKAAAAAIAAVGTAAAAGVKFLNDIAESTEEYRIAQGKLNTAFEAAGYSTKTAKEAYQTLFSILGDVDNATESAQLLAQLAKSEEDVAAWGDIAAGVVGTFGDALPINSLIEASNETAKVGQVTGTLADALNWVGISEDEFNAKLAACGDETERTNLITQTLSETYQNASDIFKENNATLMEANKAQAELDGTMARLGGTVAEVKTALTAEFAPALTEVADAFINLAEGTEGAEEELAAAIDSLIGKAAEKLPELMEFGSEIILNLLGGIANAAPQLAEGGVTLVTSLLEGLLEALPQLAEAGAQLIAGLVEGIAGAAPELVPAAAEAVMQLVQALVDNAPLLADAALDLVTGLADGILEAVPVLLEAVPELIESLVDALLDAVPEITDTGVELLTALVDNLPEIIDAIVEAVPEIIDSVVSTLLDHLPELVDAGIELLTALVEDLPEIIQTIVDALPELVASIVETLLDHVPDIVETGVELLTALITNLPHIIAEIVTAMPRIITGMVDALLEGVPQFEDVGENLVRGLWSGIQSLAGWLWNKVSNWIQSIWDGITDFFGIASPSKQMEWVGEMLVEGLAGAVEANGKKAVDAVGKMSAGMLSEVQSETAKVSGALADSASQTIQSAVQDMEDSFAAQRALISGMEAEFRASMSGAGVSIPNISGELDLSVNSFLERESLSRAIAGAERQRAAVEAAYAQSAQAALYSMERHMSSTIREPRTVSREEQTAAILSAMGGTEGGVVNHFHIGEMNVRSDADLDYIAQKLYYMQRREGRSRGGGIL